MATRYYNFLRGCILTFLISGSSFSFANDTNSSEHSGAVCIAPFPVDYEAAPHAIKLQALTKTTTFQLEFGKYQSVNLKQGQSIAISSLPLDEKIRVRVKMDGKPYESFILNLTSKNDKVCMWLYLPYVTWQIYPYSSKGYGCKCFDPPK